MVTLAPNMAAAKINFHTFWKRTLQVNQGYGNQPLFTDTKPKQQAYVCW